MKLFCVEIVLGACLFGCGTTGQMQQPGAAVGSQLAMAAGVAKPADTLCIPLQDVRTLEGNLWSVVSTDCSWFQDICAKSAIGFQPAGSLALPKDVCDTATQHCAIGLKSHLQVRTILDQPYSQIDVAGTVKLIGTLVGVAQQLKP